MEGTSILAGIVPEYLLNFVDELDEHPWLFASLASILVGLSGIFPLLVIPIDQTAAFKDGAGAATLRMLLSFAVGGLLGDVFLHLLPEAWQNDISNMKEGGHVPMKCGLWCLFGMLVFIVVEKLFAQAEHEEDEEPRVVKKGMRQLEIEEIDKLLQQERKHRAKFSKVTEGAAELPVCGSNGDITAKQLYESCLFNNNGGGEGSCCASVTSSSGVKCTKSNRWMGRCLLREAKEKAMLASRRRGDDAPQTKHVAGYLNLMANSIDNFTHGLAVGGSFLVGFRVGLLTTFAILVHEIPHEVGDFAILLKSGFSRWEAAKAQMATASAGLIGALTAVIFSGARNAIEAKTSWIVPFTAGGFLHIALITVLPDLLREEDKKESLKHLAALVSGIAVMAFMTQYFG